jgi:hypothetical protein
MWVEMLDMVAAALAIVAGGLLGYGMMLVIGEWRSRNENAAGTEPSNPTSTSQDVGTGQA